MTINKEFHPKSDIDRLYVPRIKEGEVCLVAEVASWLRRITLAGTINTEDVVSTTIYKETEWCRAYNSWKDKVMHGQYLRELDGKDRIQSWNWLSGSDLKGCKKALIASAQEQAIRSTNTKFYRDKTSDSPMCKMCGERNKTVSHIISKCSKLARKTHKRRYDNIGKYIHWKLCKKYID